MDAHYDNPSAVYYTDSDHQFHPPGFPGESLNGLCFILKYSNSLSICGLFFPIFHFYPVPVVKMRLFILI